MEILPGVWMKNLPGHTLGHQGVFFDVPGQRALYTVDLIPTVAHLPLAFIMGYDLYPMTSLETKRAILRDINGKALLLQVVLEERQRCIVVFDYQNAHRGSGHRDLTAPSPAIGRRRAKSALDIDSLWIRTYCAQRQAKSVPLAIDNLGQNDLCKRRVREIIDPSGGIVGHSLWTGEYL
jgi:hypothetical protein